MRFTWTGNTPPGLSAAAGSGDTVGPAASTDNAVARFDGVTGKLLQNCAVTIDDNGVVAAARRAVVARTIDIGVGAAASGGVTTNAGAASPVELSLPAAVAGLEYFFVVLAAQDLIVLANGSDVIRIAAGASSAGGTATASAVGAMLHLIGAATGTWVGIASGTWTLT